MTGWAEVILALGFSTSLGTSPVSDFIMECSLSEAKSRVAHPVDAWESAEAVLVFGQGDQEDEFLIVGCHKKARLETIRELFQRYLDEKFAQVTTAEERDEWEKTRARLLNPVYDAKSSSKRIEIHQGSFRWADAEMIQTLSARETGFLIRVVPPNSSQIARRQIASDPAQNTSSPD